MKKFMLLYLLLLITASVNAQSYEVIKTSAQYLCGEGFGSTLSEANDNALSELISQISVTVESSFSMNEGQSTSNGETVYKQDVQHIVKTFSNATLHNTSRLVISNEPDAHVIRYIKKEEINRIFEGRKNKVTDMVSLAESAEKKAKIDDALRYFYWAYCLLKTLPHSNEVEIQSTDGNDYVLSSWIPDQMRTIFSDIQISGQGTNGDILDLNFLYKGQPLSSIDYTYFDGMDWSNIYSARDGRGIVELRSGSHPDILQVKCEYEFRGESHIDDEIKTVMTSIKPTSFRDAYFNVDCRADRPHISVPALAGTAGILKEHKADIRTVEEDKDAVYNRAMERICTSIQEKDYSGIRELFTTEGWETFQKIIAYGRARLFSTGGERVYTFLPMGEKTVCRSLPMTFSFNTNNRVFTENVTFTFNKERKIENLAFSLGQDAEKDILTKGNWAELARLALMNFLEDYKTAYALKDLDYIENVFDENAVIITGKLFKRPAAGENGITVSKDMVKYTRYTKDEYLKRLSMSFASKEFINIRFANNDIMKMGTGGEVYGIQIKQDYYSSNYGDTGYLFLLVDINDPQAPIIKVRTWQPERDPNFGIIGPEDF